MPGDGVRSRFFADGKWQVADIPWRGLVGNFGTSDEGGAGQMTNECGVQRAKPQIVPWSGLVREFWDQ
jgi:hypothetical protein